MGRKLYVAGEDRRVGGEKADTTADCLRRRRVVSCHHRDPDPGIRKRRKDGDQVVARWVSERHQPDKGAVRTELSRMVNGYPDDPGVSGVVRTGLLNNLPAGQANDAQRTRAIAKAVCASVVGSAAMLVQ